MTEQDKKHVIEALEYALQKCIDVDGSVETHYNTLSNAVETVSYYSITEQHLKELLLAMGREVLNNTHTGFQSSLEDIADSIIANNCIDE